VLDTVKPNKIAAPAAPPTSTAQTGARPRAGWRIVVATLVVVLAVWLPRAFQLDHFVTIDESKWLVRSANFYQALTSGNLVDAFQHGHPGVTIMYAGMSGYLWQFPDYVRQVSGQYQWGDEFMAFLAATGHAPIDMLAAGRTFIVIFNVLALGLAFLYALRLIGYWPALTAFLFIALDPFHAALSRFLHPDSLLSTFMILAGLAAMAYLFAGRRLGDLIAAGVFAALAGLTKTPSIFLVPFMMLLTGIEVIQHVLGQSRPWTDVFRPASIWRWLRTLLIWAAVVTVVYFALWPALWVAPRDTLAKVLDISGDYATQGHTSPVFFNGTIYNGDPGALFYPVNYLWRTTPVVLIGLALLVAGWFVRGSLVRQRRVVLTTLGLLAMAFFFLVFMTLAAKKFDRYLLPVFPPLDILAALGWSGLFVWLMERVRAGWARVAGPALLAGAVAVQGGLALGTFPYYMSYYNPVMGGPAKAPEVMFIGWGEGLDEAARWLNAHTDIATTTVASWYERGPFSFFYDGASESNRYIWEADYSVVYNHQWQRELPNRRMLNYFDTLTPVHSIDVDGIEYVRIYDMRAAPPAPYSVEWGDAIRLVYYDTFSGAMVPGQRFDMTIYYVKTGPLDINVNLKLRLVNPDGHTLLLKEGWPDNGVATAKWEIGEILRDNSTQVDIPEGTPPGLYRMELSFYDPATFDHLPAVQLSTDQPVADPYVLDYLIVGDWPPAPAGKLDTPVRLGDAVQLNAASSVDGRTLAPGDTVDVQLEWEALRYMHTDYTAFVHVVGPDGTPVVQGDSQPMHGFLPTSYWPPRQRIADSYTLTLPADAAPGEYRVLVGWYDLATLARLPMTQDGETIGDAYTVAAFTVAPR
jgi:hypothetical protein